MSYLYPGQQTVLQSFGHPLALRRSQSNGPKTRRPAPSPYMARPELYGAYSVVDDTKAKAQKLSIEATKEFEKASATAQAKTGKIELFSAKYYAACTFGGLVACVSSPSIA
jgi:solute carrier family 25 phosphate transporter 3